LPKETTRDASGLRAAQVREGESWKEYIERLRSGPTLGAAEIAGIMSATVLMGKDPDGPARGRMLDALSERLTRQPSFRRLVRDPAALPLARAGKGAELIVHMGEKKRQEEEARRRYQRDKSQVRDDAIFLRAAEKSMKDSFAACSPAQKERESQRYLEMIKRMDHARSLAEQGIPLDGKTSRELAQAVQRYNDGGGKTPGGKKQAAASREALCVLKRLMPEEEFGGYCASINRAHQAQSPTHRRYVNPADYGEALLNGGARSAKDLMLASQRQLNRGLTLDGCAAVTAIMQLSGGNPNAIVRRDALEAEIKKLKAPGSAFLRAMSDPDARGKFAELANQGRGVMLAKSIIGASKAHSVRSAQWQINQSVASVSREGGASPEKLAAILAAREMAMTSGPDQSITNGAFKTRTERIRGSANFSALATKYREDPSFRAKINMGLAKGDGGKTLEQEYRKINAPQKEKTVEAPVLKKPEGA
jgi:hypothetical protein